METPHIVFDHITKSVKLTPPAKNPRPFSWAIIRWITDPPK